MTEPTIICPNCKTEIRLTESLAAPLIAATRQQYEQQIAQKDLDFAKREQSLREKEKQVAEEKASYGKDATELIAEKQKAMEAAARNLDFIKAAKLRDEIAALKG